MKVRVGVNGLPGNLVEGDILGAQLHGGGYNHTVANPFRVFQGPAHGLHAAQAAADHGRPALDAQSVGEHGLAVDPVAGSQWRKIRAVGFTAVRVYAERPCRTMTAADIVQADHEEVIGIDGFAGADAVFPPARL